MSLEGVLRVALHVSDGRIDRVRVTSTRPDVATALLQGRTVAAIQAAVPRLFSICGQAQAAASELACAAAGGAAPTADTLARCSAAVSAETVREGALRCLLDWPSWLGESPADDALGAARAALVLRPGVPAPATVDAIAAATFGLAADEWLALHSLTQLDRWIDGGRTACARFIRQVRDDDTLAAVGGAAAEHPVPWLDGLLGVQHGGHAGGRRGDLRSGAVMVELWSACAADAGFARRPTWQGAAAETGALARWHDVPLIDALARRSRSRVPARFVARLHELALLLAGRTSAAVGAQGMPAGGGSAWVETARGLLVHQVQVQQGHASLYRIVAPTEWNFHPDGALASALLATAAADVDRATQRVTRLVQSLDPCVACRVEFDPP